MRKVIFFISAVLFLSLSAALACTIVMVSRGGVVLAGNNEDWKNPATKIWFYPAAEGEYGRVCYGFDRGFGFAQGGMNDQGLFIDGNALSPTGYQPTAGKPDLNVPIMDKILAECATIDDVIGLFKKYNTRSLAQARFPVADRTGASMVVEFGQGKVQFVKKTGDYQIATNFVISHHEKGPYPCWRYTKAETMCREADKLDVSFIASVLDATHQEGNYPTQYSTVCDLVNGEIYLYYLYNFKKFVKFNLEEELKKGKRTYDIKDLFAE